MPLGAARIALFAKSQVTAVAEVIRRKVGVTAVGNAQVDTAQSQFGGASALFDGAGDLLQISDPTAITVASSQNLTVESWVRLTGASGGAIITDELSNGDISLTLGVGNGGVGQAGNGAEYPWFGFYNGSWVGAASSTQIVYDTWVHLAGVYDGTNIKLYMDGVEMDSVAANWQDIETSTLYIGRRWDNSGSVWYNGHIDEVRVSNTARYTANFTPQTEPHVNDENTLLLLHMDGTDGSQFFEDDNGVRPKIGMQTKGTPQISTTQSKFGGASLRCDGSFSSDAIGLPTGYGLWNGVGTGDFSMECWFYIENDVQNDILDTRDANAPLEFDYPAIFHRETNTLDVLIENSLVITSGNGVVTPGQWEHVALVRQNGVFTAYLNGTQVGSTFSSSIDMTGAAFGVGDYFFSGGGSADFDGWIDEVRASNTARYTANFTPQTEPFVNDANTLLLLHMDGTDGSTDFPDDVGGRTKVGVSAVGNAQVDTAQSVFGGASALFDGTGDYLRSTTFPALGTGDFTIEYFIRFENLPSANNFMSFDARPGSNGAYPLIFHENNTPGNIAYFVSGGFRITTGAVLSADTWHHIAVVRSSGTTKLYIDGTQQGSNYSDGTDYQASTRLTIGANMNNINSLDGHIDEVRISNTARYTANFTPPTEPFQNDDNTLLLLHMDGTDGSTTFIDDNGVPPNHDYGA